MCTITCCNDNPFKCRAVSETTAFPTARLPTVRSHLSPRPTYPPAPLDHPKAAAAMGRRARRRVLRGMDVRRYAEAHVRLYEDLVRERRQWEAIKYQPPTSPVTSSTPTIPTVPTTPTPIIPPTPATLQAPTTPTTPTTPRADKGPLRTTIVNPVRIVSPGNGTALATSELLLRTSLTSLPPNHRLVVAVDGGALMRVDRTNGVMLGGLTPGHHRVSIFVVVASEHATPQYASTRGVTGGE